jgi:hypothetical protein
MTEALNYKSTKETRGQERVKKLERGTQLVKAEKEEKRRDL